MGLARPTNFRDVGEALGSWIAPSPIASNRLFRGGKIDLLTTAEDIGNPRTILNLRRGPDPTHLAEITIVHVPAIDGIENYKTSTHRVRQWLSDALRALITATPPVYVHCTAGRDRTGIVIAAALLLADVSPTTVIEEYMLSEGANAVSIRTAIDGILLSRTELIDKSQVRDWLTH